MPTIQEESYKKGVESAVERWKKKIAAIGDKAKAPREELEDLRALKSPGPAEKKRIAELEAALEKLTKEVEKATTELKLDVMLLGPVEMPKGTPKSKLDALPKWMRELIKAKGVPLGKGVVITPEVEFNWTTFQPKYIGVKIKW